MLEREERLADLEGYLGGDHRQVHHVLIVQRGRRSCVWDVWRGGRVEVGEERKRRELGGERQRESREERLA